MSYTDKKNQVITHPPSDGSELIPAEVQANTRAREETPKSINEPLTSGYKVDDEGIVNNYALEPKMSEAKYPSPRKQRRYILLGAAAILFVVLALLIAFSVS